MANAPSVVDQFEQLWRDVERNTYGTVLLADCEPEFSRVLAFAQTHPEARSELADAFSKNLASYVTRFCMQHLQWPEIAKAAYRRMAEDVHNSEYEALQQLLSVYEKQTI
jgi:hypothetical protein